MGKIQLLDTATTNKIAAGEVVANPASVVKELVENSLDAGSTRVSVKIIRGGIDGIKVVDNGWGIASEDLKTAFMRHATSKIKEFTDLDSVSTMGFRGEALASIASVSRVTMTTRLRGNTEGYRIAVEAGAAGDTVPVGCAEGTNVEVNDLFYNVPARRKFLNAPGRETAAVNEVVSRLALGNPEVAFKLKNDSKTVFETYGGGDVLTAVAAILGPEVLEHLIPVESLPEALPGWRVTGYISTPFYNRSSRKWQYFFVNKRWVSNPKLRYALDHGYRSMIPRGRYPIAILFLEVTGNSIDVNVDPTKNTIRISEDRAVLNLMINAVRNALSDHRRAKGILPETEGYPQSSFPPSTIASDQDLPLDLEQQLSVSKWGNSGNYEAYHINEGCNGNGNAVSESAAEGVDVSPGFGKDSKHYKILAQLSASYILYEQDAALYIVDQHAAHERIRFEEIRNKPRGTATQLVIPETVTVTPSQIALLEQLTEELETAGFQFEFFGGNSVVLREIPLEMSFGNPGTAFRELLELVEENLGSFKDLEESFMYSLACKTAVKAGQILSRDEMEAIVDGLLQCREPWTCPHGRPTTITLTAEKLLKEFKRK